MYYIRYIELITCDQAIMAFIPLSYLFEKTVRKYFYHISKKFFLQNLHSSKLHEHYKQYFYIYFFIFHI